MNGCSDCTEDKVDSITENESREREKRGVRYQIIVSLVANMTVLGPAMGFGYSAVARGPLMSPSSDIKVNESQANWIATSAALGTPLGCVFSSIILGRGRKLTLLVTAVISLIGWLTIYLSSNYELILVGRVISGIATGLASAPATIYSAEVCGAKWRSTIITWTSMAIALAILIIYIIGYLLEDNWRLMALICALFPMMSIVLILMVLPETPIWLRDHGRMNEAIAIFKRLRGVPKNLSVPPELLTELEQKVQPKKRNLMRNIFKRSSLIPLAIMLSYFFFQQFSGIFVVVYYAVDITKEAGIDIDARLGAILIGITRVFGTVLICYVSRKFGRRLPSIISGAGMTFFMIVLSMYLFMTDKGCVVQGSTFIPVTCVLMYIFMSTMGFLVLPFAMIGEVYPSKVKDILSGVTVCVAYIFSSITIKIYPDMLTVFGKHGVFLFYAVVSLFGTIFVVLFLPETKGKTLKELDDLYSKKKKKQGTPITTADEAIIHLKTKAGDV